MLAASSASAAPPARRRTDPADGTAAWAQSLGGSAAGQSPPVAGAVESPPGESAAAARRTTRLPSAGTPLHAVNVTMPARGRHRWGVRAPLPALVRARVAFVGRTGGGSHADRGLAVAHDTQPLRRQRGRRAGAGGAPATVAGRPAVGPDPKRTKHLMVTHMCDVGGATQTAGSAARLDEFWITEPDDGAVRDERCCGLSVHKKTVVACVVMPAR